ncbi:MAG: DNRLRE domain-containing protein, partial [Chitinophagaceae bacterium]|nr:DNRLRE domain-containing protein [Chitinophagaceae bacterium]
MKQFYLISTLLLLFQIISNAQSPVCITLQPDGATGQDAVIASFYPGGNFGDYTELDAHAWTSGGNPSNLRGLIKFDLSGIPSNAVITSAKISLYAVTTAPLNGNLVDPMFGANAAYLQRITADWSPSTVTWNNQPATTTSNQVTLATSTSTTQNYTNIDVTSLILDMRTNGNYGFLLKAID